MNVDIRFQGGACSKKALHFILSFVCVESFHHPSKFNTTFVVDTMHVAGRYVYVVWEILTALIAPYS